MWVLNLELFATATPCASVRMHNALKCATAIFVLLITTGNSRQPGRRGSSSPGRAAVAKGAHTREPALWPVTTIAPLPFYNAKNVVLVHFYVQPGYGLHVKMILRPQ